MKTLENEAIRLAVAHGGGASARIALAQAVKQYRKAGNNSQAKWLLRHVYYITGNLWK